MYVKLLLVLGIVALGYCASLPFRHGDDQGEHSPPLAVDGGLNLRPGEKSTKLVPLAVSPESEISPAAGGLPIDRANPLRTTAIWAHERPEDAAPADIGPNFSPLVEVFPATNLPSDGNPGSPIRAPQNPAFSGIPDQPSPGGAGLVGVESIPATTVRHRLRDGDTLARLAQRYLGDENRANEIYQANRQILTSAEVLPLGVEIEIPGARVSGDR